MLAFIGLGLYDHRDITLRGIEEAKSCELLFMEEYTSFLPGGGIKDFSEVLGREILLLTRKEVEERGEDVILEPAKTKKVGLLVPGDPLISTTHVSLRLRARELGIPSRVVHNASILSAAPSISGLQNYKFGRSASIPFPTKGFFPETPYDVVKQNLKAGLHTLLYLDIKVKEDGIRAMRAMEGVEYLLRIEEKRREGVFPGSRLCIALGGVGSEDPALLAAEAATLLETKIVGLPQCLIVPGKLHFIEEEYLRAFAGLP
jgi:diphthine synthase